MCRSPPRNINEVPVWGRFRGGPLMSLSGGDLPLPTGRVGQKGPAGATNLTRVAPTGPRRYKSLPCAR
eukprot:3185203-Alexandrium_andersonii.AAC.1